MSTSSVPDPNHALRWVIMLVVGVAELVVVLDATIVNIALPSAQADLGFSNENRQWIITAYALAFGSLLLVGGRIGDLFGRKQTLVVGLIGFAAASALGGAATNFELLVTARALQGGFGALLAPAALAILSVTFTDDAERNKAFGIFGALAGVGAGIGLLLGGALTEWLSWSWCLYVNLVFAIPTAIGAVLSIRAHHWDRTAGGHSRTIDIPGTVTGTLAVFAVVFGFSNAEAHGWHAPLTIVAFVAAPVLLIAFVLIERVANEPLLPLRVLLSPTRAGSYLSIAVLGIAMFGVFLFLTYYLQQNLGYSPLKAGVAFMPMNITIMVVAGAVSGALLPRFGPRVLIVAGLLISGLGMVCLAQIDSTSGYLSGVLPGLMLIGIAGGLLYSTTYAAGTLGVDERDMGVASAMLNTAQQIGGSIGTALLSTLFASAVADYATENPGPKVAIEAGIHGYTTVFWWGAGITFGGAAITFFLMRNSNAELARSWVPGTQEESAFLGMRDER